MNTQVPIGATSIFGWSFGILGFVPTIIQDIETGKSDWAGPQKYGAIAGLVLLAITQTGRYLQAHKLISSTVSEDIDKGVGEVEEIVNQLPLAPKPAAGEVPKDNSVLASPVNPVNQSPANIGEQNG